MKTEDKRRILSSIDQLGSTQSDLGPQKAERLLMSVLEPLLAEDGYDVQQTPRFADGGLDFIGQRSADEQHNACKLGVQFKYYRSGRPIAIEAVRGLLGAAVLNQIDRAILLVNTNFTKSALEMARRELPLQLELVDLDALRAWVARMSLDDEALVSEVRQILTAVSQRFARLIARNPSVLAELEWRDMERTIAEVFDRLGFDVELTPSSKDGGKDVVLECIVEGTRQTYIVEIKHWRSSSRVGGGAVSDFLNVIVRERREGGLFLSTYGYCDNAFEELSQIDRQKLRFGDQDKIVALCRTYVKAESGLWSPPERLPELLYEHTS